MVDLLQINTAGKIYLVVTNFMCVTAWTLFYRKRGLLLNNLTGVLGAILMGSSKAAMSYEMIIIGRFFIGFNCG